MPRRRAVIEITDEAGLEHPTLAEIDTTAFLVGAGVTIDEVPAEERDEVRGDSVAAISWLADPGGLVRDLPCIEFVEGSHSVMEVGAGGSPLSPGPDFAALFALCRCANESCDACSEYQ